MAQFLEDISKRAQEKVYKVADKLNHTRDKIVKTLVKAGHTLKEISQEELPQLKREWFENSEVMQGMKER